MRELRYLMIAAAVYLLLCGLMLLWQPQMSIEPVSLMSRRLKSVDTASRSHGGEVRLSHMKALLNSRMFKDQGIKLKWIRERMKRMSESWEVAQHRLVAEKPHLFSKSLRILLFPGLLSEYSAYDFANNAFKGGYLGELVQWSDLISSLHMLGHHVTVYTSRKQLSNWVSTTVLEFDIVFTDYLGLFGLRDSKHFAMYKCRIRILDSFGTEPIFNFRTKDFQKDDGLTMFNNWNFEDLRQFWTLFPHTPDNSFLGFVVEAPAQHLTQQPKKSQGVLYGKEGYYAYGKEHYLNAIGEVIELHSTFKDMQGVPPHVVNHGILSASELHKLLAESKVFIGLGFPYDGPGPLEALANGCSFIQPALLPPHDRGNTPFLSAKPTARQLSSQMPYLEHYIGEPYVYTVDIRNSSAVRSAVYKSITRANPQPFIPHEFTHQGMLERVGTYLAHQNFCDGHDLARGKIAMASSVHQDHTPGQAVDGLLAEETCFWSTRGFTHWWHVDLGADYTLLKIRITNTLEWILAKNWGDVFLDPFSITLLDGRGNQVAERSFTDSRNTYLWEDINVRARFVRIDSLDYEDSRYLVLCAVQVYGVDTQYVPWPDLTLLHTVKSKPGQSCKESCHHQGMVCEPAFARALNSRKVLNEFFHCNGSQDLSDIQYVDFPPAQAVDANNVLQVPQGHCITNGNNVLLSCAGKDDAFQRLCPCRKFIHGQVAVPPLT